jgi:hypothetical protein
MRRSSPQPFAAGADRRADELTKPREHARLPQLWLATQVAAVPDQPIRVANVTQA